MSDARDAALSAAFAERYGRPPTVRVRAPGRVNIIGEHTDYNGLPVLPFAIDRDVRVVAAPRDDLRINVASLSPRFPARSYAVERQIQANVAGDWANYHRGAAQCLIDNIGAGAVHGGDFLVDGNVPPSAGLSSSSALMVGNLLALLALERLDIPRLDLADIAAIAEQYVGTQSGGMDQAVCLLAQADHALRIDFFPLVTRPVAVPRGAAFVVCHSLVEAEKSGAARQAYNRRVHECRLACEILRKYVDRRLKRLGSLRELAPDVPLNHWVNEFGRVASHQPMTVADVAYLLGKRPEDVAAGSAVGDTAYPLFRRVRHVLTEAERVDAAAVALAAGDWAGLGALMDASHASCRDDYEVSCPELEELVAAARAAGALGARLTGAGFGGCTINLVPAANAAAFVETMERTFYRGRPGAAEREHCFVVVPSAGASVSAL